MKKINGQKLCKECGTKLNSYQRKNKCYVHQDKHDILRKMPKEDIINAERQVAEGLTRMARDKKGNRREAW